MNCFAFINCVCLLLKLCCKMSIKKVLFFLALDFWKQEGGLIKATMM